MEKSILLKAVALTYVCIKKNQFSELLEDEIYYFKISKKDSKTFNNIAKVEGARLPWWISAKDKDTFIKCKYKFVDEFNFVKGDKYTCDIEIKSYSIDKDDGELIGYYVSRVSRLSGVSSLLLSVDGFGG